MGTDKAKELPDEWSEEEKLYSFNESSNDYSTSRSIANRNSDTVRLFHLWAKIPVYSLNQSIFVPILFPVKR